MTIDLQKEGDPKMQKVYTSGNGKFFGFLNSTLLIVEEIEGSQVTPNNWNVLLPQLKSTGPLFIESQNFGEIPDQLKGVLVCFCRRKLNKAWKLGIIQLCNFKTQVVEALIWNDPATAVDRI